MFDAVALARKDPCVGNGLPKILFDLAHGLHAVVGIGETAKERGRLLRERLPEFADALAQGLHEAGIGHLEAAEAHEFERILIALQLCFGALEIRQRFFFALEVKERVAHAELPLVRVFVALADGLEKADRAKEFGAVHLGRVVVRTRELVGERGMAHAVGFGL